MNLDQLHKKVFKGFLADEEANSLYELARKAAPLAPCLEIGSYCGHSTAYLGLGCREAGGVLFSIDHHRGSQEQQPGQEYHDPDLFDRETGGMNTFPYFCKTILELSLEDSVVPIVSRSELVARFWKTPLSLIFIDGGHSFEDAFADYNGWVSHLIHGGYLLLHDIFHDPSRGGQAPFRVYKLALASGLFLELPMVGTLGALKRAPVGSSSGESLPSSPAS